MKRWEVEMASQNCQWKWDKYHHEDDKYHHEDDKYHHDDDKMAKYCSEYRNSGYLKVLLGPPQKR